MQRAPQFRLFCKGHLLQGPTFRAVRNAHRAVHVDAAQHGHALGCATEDFHQVFRLCTRTDDKVDHHIRSKALEFLSASAELVAVAPNLLHAGGYSRRAAVKQGQHVSLLL